MTIGLKIINEKKWLIFLNFYQLADGIISNEYKINNNKRLDDGISLRSLKKAKSNFFKHTLLKCL
jgi:hypothetical protein